MSILIVVLNFLVLGNLFPSYLYLHFGIRLNIRILDENFWNLFSPSRLYGVLSLSIFILLCFFFFFLPVFRSLSATKSSRWMKTPVALPSFFSANLFVHVCLASRKWAKGFNRHDFISGILSLNARIKPE